MNKNQLVDAVAASVGDRRTAAAAVEAVLDTITRTVAAGERVALTGFGVFEKADRAARAARNPATGATVQVPATSVPRFRAGTGFRDVVGGKRPASRTATAPAQSERAEQPTRATKATAKPTKATAKPAKATAKPAKPATSAKPAKGDKAGKPGSASGKAATSGASGKGKDGKKSSAAGKDKAGKDKAGKGRTSGGKSR